jgi:hypothetical protein
MKKGARKEQSRNERVKVERNGGGGQDGYLYNAYTVEVG